MLRSQREKEEWERRRWYLTRSLFQDLAPLTPILEAADHEVHSDSSESLPELIIQVVPKRKCGDDPEGSYQELENIIKKQLKRDADIINGRLFSETEMALTCNLEETASNEDTYRQECSIDSIIEAMRCPAIISSHHTEVVPNVHHSLDSPHTPLALLKILTPTPLSHSSASTNSSPKRLITPSSQSPTSSTKLLPRRISTRTPQHSSQKYPTTFSPLTHSSPKSLTMSVSPLTQTLPKPLTSSESSSQRLSLLASSTRRSSRKRTSDPSLLKHSSPKPLPPPKELSSKRQSSLISTSRRSSRKRTTSVPSPLTFSSSKTLASSTELSLKPQSVVASSTRRSSRKRQPSLPSPLTHSSPKRQSMSVLPLTNSPPHPPSSRQLKKGLTSVNSKSRRPSRKRTSLSDTMRENVTLQHSPISSPENSKTPQYLGPRNIEKSLQTSLSDNLVHGAEQSSLYNNQLDKAIQTSLCNNQRNRAIQTSPIDDDTTYNFWGNIFVGEPLIYDIVPRRNLN